MVYRVEKIICGQTRHTESFSFQFTKLSDKGFLWKYSIQRMKTADSVFLNLFMKDNGICDIPHAA